MSGKRQKIQYALAFTRWPWYRKAGVKPRFAVTKGPNHPGRSQHPKARLAQNN
jgi:hypothetical protein